MLIATQIFDRVFGAKHVLSLYFGERPEQNLAIGIMHDLRTRKTRDIRRMLAKDAKDSLQPILIIDAKMVFGQNFACRDLCGFLERISPPRFSHYVWRTDSDTSQELFARLVRKIGLANAFIGHTGDHNSSTQCFYPVKKGQQLAIVHFAV